MGDHTETIQIDFDPQQISFGELLKVFWDSHSPAARSWGRQYRSVVLYHDQAQLREIEASRHELQLKLRRPIQTAVEAYRSFTRAEDYHQKYTLRSWKDVMDELRRIYPDERSFVDSTVATRLNGYLARRGDPRQLEAELPRMGLSEDLMRAIRDRVYEN